MWLKWKLLLNCKEVCKDGLRKSDLVPLGSSTVVSSLPTSSLSSHLCCLQGKTKGPIQAVTGKQDWVRTKVPPSEEQQHLTERQLLEEAECETSTHLSGRSPLRAVRMSSHHCQRLLPACCVPAPGWALYVRWHVQYWQQLYGIRYYSPTCYRTEVREVKKLAWGHTASKW